MEHRFTTDEDLDLLAEWNHQLICDEGYGNPMMVSELRVRMKEWLTIGHNAVVLGPEAAPVACALYRDNMIRVSLRQLFVRRART